jgi:hypothetical protein
MVNRAQVSVRGTLAVGLADNVIDAELLGVTIEAVE